MKSKLYYVLYFLYAVVVAFVLYLNGVFTGNGVLHESDHQYRISDHYRDSFYHIFRQLWQAEQSHL